MILVGGLVCVSVTVGLFVVIALASNKRRRGD
jgi:hypothetical protein